ncbi:7-cyano-7-deazaguanine synthase [Echinicola shivajiensis]|uniref:7-cyano-7-deazaguanine synthase n=1 Tax=Echinicola shivajiensis TaxID=1035916 RepID=UPI001BFCAA21|nr:7-cyano-7-deazaguanine synthase [Echinicola shivajiensis]
MKNFQKKSILLLSGGLDSAALSLELMKKNEKRISLYFDFGNLSSKRGLDASRAIAGLTDSRLDVIQAKGLLEAFGSSELASVDPAPNPGEHVIELGTLLILPTALTYAHRMNSDVIYIGYSKLDADASPEYTQKFLNSISNLSELAGFPKIKIEAPFISNTKSEVLKKLVDHFDILKQSWSCIYGGKKHCGTCQACLSRKEAFKDAKLKDPTKYL